MRFSRNEAVNHELTNQSLSIIIGRRHRHNQSVAWPGWCDHDELVPVDIEMKRKAIEQARPIHQGDAGVEFWRADASILKWLEDL